MSATTVTTRPSAPKTGFGPSNGAPKRPATAANTSSKAKPPAATNVVPVELGKDEVFDPSVLTDGAVDNLSAAILRGNPTLADNFGADKSVEHRRAALGIFITAATIKATLKAMIARATGTTSKAKAKTSAASPAKVVETPIAELPSWEAVDDRQQGFFNAHAKELGQLEYELYAAVTADLNDHSTPDQIRNVLEALGEASTFFQHLRAAAKAASAETEAMATTKQPRRGRNGWGQNFSGATVDWAYNASIGKSSAPVVVKAPEKGKKGKKADKAA